MTTARELGDFGGVVTVEAGNVGLGVTPAAWDATYRALQINTTGAINANSVAVVMSNNYRYDGTNFRYLTTAPASDYYQFNGTHTWRYAASGTAGAVATMNTGMVMDASGNVGVGVTPSAWGAYTVLQNKNFSLCGFDYGQGILTLNGYYDGSTWRAVSTGAATQYKQFVGQHQWFTAPSASAGGALTWTQSMTLDSSGNLLVGTTSAFDSAYTMSVQVRNATGGIVIRPGSDNYTAMSFRTAGNTQVGNITVGPSSTSFVTTSDYRLKEDVQPMTGALAKVAALKPVTYKWKSTGEASQGFIAHELAEVCPDAVSGKKDAVNEDGSPVYQGIDTSFLVATLTAAIQEQQALITSLTARIAALEGSSNAPAPV
jgi:hypothetical protein